MLCLQFFCQFWAKNWRFLLKNNVWITLVCLNVSILKITELVRKIPISSHFERPRSGKILVYFDIF
jgi:hypothetical protein